MRRHAVSLACLVVAIAIGRLWAASAPALWLALLGLDRLGASRAARHAAGEGADAAAGSTHALWSYFPAIAVGSIAAVAVILLLSGSVGD